MLKELKEAGASNTFIKKMIDSLDSQGGFDQVNTQGYAPSSEELKILGEWFGKSLHSGVEYIELNGANMTPENSKYILDGLKQAKESDNLNGLVLLNLDDNQLTLQEIQTLINIFHEKEEGNFEQLIITNNKLSTDEAKKLVSDYPDLIFTGYNNEIYPNDFTKPNHSHPSLEQEEDHSMLIGDDGGSQDI